MDTVKKGEKDCEEETLQTAFKKLRVDAERYLINSALFKMYSEYNSKTRHAFFLHLGYKFQKCEKKIG